MSSGGIHGGGGSAAAVTSSVEVDIYVRVWREGDHKDEERMAFYVQARTTPP